MGPDCAANGFVQVHTGIGVPIGPGRAAITRASCGRRFGYTLAQDQGFGRAWSPMVEVLAPSPRAGLSNGMWCPQMQVSLSKLQHVLLNVGVRIPLNEREDRRPESWPMSSGTGSTAGCSSSGNERVPLAIAVWLLSLLLADSRARDAGRTADRERDRARESHRISRCSRHSENCLACHNNLVTPAGEDVSIGATWRSTMMANSARDPYWQAAVRRETIDHPTHAADIQDECAACHMPMAQHIARAAGRQGEVFAHLPSIARGRSRPPAARRRRRVLHGVPSDRAGRPRHARQLQRRTS